jgi:hypothetical protein
MKGTYTHPDLQKCLIIYLRKRGGRRFQDLEGLPESIRYIVEDQDRIGWAKFAKGGVTKRIKDIQTMYMCNRGTMYMEDYWMGHFIKNIMCSTHKQWLGWNLMKNHHIKGIIAIKTRVQLARELDRLLNKDIHNIAGKNRWMLDYMDPLNRAVMSMWEMQFAVFELKAAKAQDTVVFKQTSRQTKDFTEHCRIPGVCVPTRNDFGND